MSKIVSRIKRYALHPMVLIRTMVAVLIDSRAGHVLLDKAYIKIKWWTRFGISEKLDLANPQGFNQKIQWLKLYDLREVYTTMVDKYEVKKYVADQIGKQYIVPTLGIFDTFDEIDFDSFPNQFVMKCTHDSGGLVICRDKSKLDYEKARTKINKSLKCEYFYRGREWPYKNVKPRIIIEKYMEDSHNESKGLRDYKFYCFDGEPKFLYISEGLEDHSTASISFVKLDWNFAPFKRSDYRAFDELPTKPEGFDEMLVVCRKLSRGIPFLRCDLYEVNGNIYFSELTFSPCDGLMPFDPPESNLEIGKLLQLPNHSGGDITNIYLPAYCLGGGVAA